jgi:hypothetical protein
MLESKSEVTNMTIKINRTANINAIGHHSHSNSKPVVRIAPFAIYASLTDAAEQNDCTIGAISVVCNKHYKYCKGVRYCWLSDLMEHLDEITDGLNAQKTKADAWDAMLAKQKAEKEAREKYTQHKTNVEKLREQLAEEEQLMLEAEQVCKSFN